jgi:hypothetical protein
MNPKVLALVAFAFLGAAPTIPAPNPALHPPKGITPAQTREAFPWSFSGRRQYPKQTWTSAERKLYEQRVDWFHKAKYGIFFHFLSGGKWTRDQWNRWVDAVDVEKVADQAKEIGAGYVCITLGQNQIYSCAPNAVIEKVWGPYTSKRDLPLDLARALKKRGIPLLLYIATDNQYQMPRPASFRGNDRFQQWIDVARWYSDHYGADCKGWWVDGLEEFTKDYCRNIHKALKHGNPDALVCSGQYELSDMLHGHCRPEWYRQSLVVKPFYGRWDPDFNIQWHVFQYVGGTWGAPGCTKKTEDLVKYASDVVRGGGVITFDLGTFKKSCFWQYPSNQPAGDGVGPYLEIQPDQFEQLKAVRDALQKIPVSDGRQSARGGLVPCPPTGRT